MRLFVLMILSLLCVHGFSQQVYSLEDCFAAAKKNNISFKKTNNIIQAAYIDKKAATFNLFPSVYANAEHIFSAGKNIDPVTNSFVRDNFSGGEFDITLQLNIFSGFNAVNAIKSSLYKIKAGEYALQKNELETFSAITIAYAKVMYYNEQSGTVRSNNLRTQNELEVVQEKIDAGKLSKSDYYTINTRYKSEQADLVEAQHDSLNALNELKYLIGLNYNTSFETKEIDSSEIKDIANKEFNLAEVLNKILKDHPALQQTVYAEKSAQLNLKAARGNLIPDVSLTGNIFSNYNLSDRNINGSHIAFSNQLNNNFGKTVGVLIEIPIFNKYQNRLAVEREKINLDNAKLAGKEVENEVVKNTQQLLNDFLSAKQKYVLETEALKQEELSYEAFEERHRLGYITSLELVVAKDQLFAQQVKATQSKYDLYFRYKLIELLLQPG